MSRSREALSKAVSHALRHEPWLYELEIDEQGWVPVDELLEALRRSAARWSDLRCEDLSAMIDRSPKQRHELAGDRIRALYGHSLPGRIVKQSAVPPESLFHGTSEASLAAIYSSGLLPMGRQYVHLSVDYDTAMAVARRKGSRPAIMRVAAIVAATAGVQFWRGNEMVWLTLRVPSQFLRPANEAHSQ